ncbi:cell wall-binding repeat-containing protein [Ornithinimicrobium sp. F0845]|uniref:cell wall-binding repeat-containing protein n=1 Tax=Ornithinimicrobium sp. F0845 TaxID=2926412 RepID=UPI001FF117B0|nr:cell wall-binding repeat-containing protein [Ornithinimicrobium sp. F0845]MCK0112705.1 cell wall-binding repeat-containing protein [Ornithinimicrobium sp. F0845]
MSNKKKFTRGSVAAVAGIGVVVGMMPAVTANAAPGQSDDSGPEISSEVTAELKATGSADVWLTLSDQADLSAAYTMSWEDRGHYVYDTLRAHAAESQADLVADLEAQGADYQTFWVNNSILVKGASADLVSSVTSDSTLSAVTPDRTPELIDGAPASSEVNSTAPLATEWGLDSIGAPEVWDTYGTTGEGIVVGTFDTGADTTHPALNAAYRGTATGSHDYNWFDSTGASATPVDHGIDIGVPHGTHVTGTMVGEDGANQIGVAPGAQFIVAAGCCVDEADVFESFEWFVAPTPVGGTEGDPDMRPHIVNNSWGFVDYQGTDPVLEASLDAWDAAGIFGTFASGNEGPGAQFPGPDCDNVMSPAWNDAAHYVVGNHQQNGAINPSSSRGPGEDGQPAVDIAAPGTNVRSSVPGDGYQNWDGTSMATPHVSGAVALLWSYFPDLVGNQAATVAALDATAIDKADPTCGGDASNNETWGEGQIDLVAAFESLEEPPADGPSVSRAAGVDRYATAGAVSELFEAEVDTVYLASGQNYPDAVTGSPAAAQGKLAVAGMLNTPDGNPAPVLLSKSGKLTNATTAALTELAPSNVIILGGESIINADVEATLAEDYTVTRVAGADRYETAANLAAMFTGTDTVYVAAGTDNAFSDALTASALAGAENAPVLLTKPDSVPNVTAEAIAELAPSQIVVIGGSATISDEVYTELGATGRLGGANKFETAALISAEFGADVPVVYVASANDYPDALASSALAGSQGAPVVVVKGTHDAAEDKIPAVIEDALKTLSPEQVVIVGGDNAVDDSVQAWLEDPANWG